METGSEMYSSIDKDMRQMERDEVEEDRDVETHTRQKEGREKGKGETKEDERDMWRIQIDGYF